jgi:hypothetical protein
LHVAPSDSGGIVENWSHASARWSAFRRCGGLAAAVLGGVLGWIAAFSGLRLWGLVIGLGASVIVMLAIRRRAHAHPPFSAMAAFGFAFILLTWPLLWLLVGLVRYCISGQSLGD